MEKVAKILLETSQLLLESYPDLDVVVDGNGDNVIHEEEAKELLESAEYSLIDWVEPYIGAPRPRKRK